jgi:AraC family transcriptional regulator
MKEPVRWSGRPTELTKVRQTKEHVMSMKIPIFWEQFAEDMYLKEMPSANLSVCQFAPFSFARVWSEQGLPEITRGKDAARDYMVTLQLRDIPFAEQFQGSRKVSARSHPAGAVSVLSLEDRPRVFLPSPFDTLILGLSQKALDEVAYSHRVPRVDRLVWPFGHTDLVVNHLGHVLVSTLQQPSHTSPFFIDHVMHALHFHFVCSFGGIRQAVGATMGLLTPHQMRKATEFLEAHLEGDINLQQVAEKCDLSVSHFARSFRQTCGKPPYRWLIERRLDKAQDLMANTRKPIADIAIQCGFTDQSGFNRSFKRMYGVTPGFWRRTKLR